MENANLVWEGGPENSKHCHRVNYRTCARTKSSAAASKLPTAGCASRQAVFAEFTCGKDLSLSYNPPRNPP